jgi:ABC-type glycerol-3-phosphate transport system substrate-binding protein
MSNKEQESLPNLFQMGLLGLFTILAVLSVILFATYKGDESELSLDVSPLTIWGPAFPEVQFRDMFESLAKSDPSLDKISYVEKNTANIYAELTMAIAEGRAPDLILLEAPSLLELRSQLYPIKLETLPLSTFSSTYVEGAEIFVQPEGTYALPLFVDPLVLFWNRDLFTSALLTKTPEDWDTFVKIVPKLSNIKGGADLTKSAIAFGEYDNVLHAKEIISTLLMQTGSLMVYREGKKFVSGIEQGASKDAIPIRAVQFYTDFANPRKTVYSWNKTYERSREAFAGNKVAMYGGFASEVPVLAKINPNLNFDIMVWPQSATGRNKLTYGRFYGLAVLKNSTNLARAYSVAFALTSPTVASVWSKKVGLPSVRRDTLSVAPDDPYSEVLIKSAILAKTTLIPHAGGASNEIFSRMINSVTAGGDPDGALTTASQDLSALLERYRYE